VRDVDQPDLQHLLQAAERRLLLRRGRLHRRDRAPWASSQSRITSNTRVVVAKVRTRCGGPTARVCAVASPACPPQPTRRWSSPVRRVSYAIRTTQAVTCARHWTAPASPGPCRTPSAGPWRLSRPTGEWSVDFQPVPVVVGGLDDAGLSARQVPDHLGHSRPSLTQDVYLGRGTDSPRPRQPSSEPSDPPGRRGPQPHAAPTTRAPACRLAQVPPLLLDLGRRRQVGPSLARRELVGDALVMRPRDNLSPWSGWTSR